MNSGNQHEPKIIVDEDWKQRVEAERQLDSQAADAPRAAPQERGPFPSASFEILVSTFSTQALVGLGFLADPQSPQGQVDLPLAKHGIDMLTVIQEKTRGNLTAQESEVLEESIHQLRLAYVAQSGAGQPAAAPAKSKLELP